MAWLQVLVAAGTGILSGMAVGGGSTLVPALVFLFGVGQRQAQAATLLYFLPAAALASAYHYWVSRAVRPPMVVWLCAGAVPGALAGAALAAAAPEIWLRRGFGVYLVAIAVYVFFHTPEGGDRPLRSGVGAGRASVALNFGAGLGRGRPGRSEQAARPRRGHAPGRRPEGTPGPGVSRNLRRGPRSPGERGRRRPPGRPRKAP